MYPMTLALLSTRFQSNETGHLWTLHFYFVFSALTHGVSAAYRERHRKPECFSVLALGYNLEFSMYLS